MFGGGMPSIGGTDKHALEVRLSRFGWILMRRYVDGRKVHRLGGERERGIAATGMTIISPSVEILA